MQTIVPSPVPRLPALVSLADDRAQLRFLEFFAVTIRNRHTRRAYGRAIGEFLGWCSLHGISSLAAVQPLHVATWIEQLGREVSAPTVKQHLAGVRHLFDWLVTGQVVPVNPAASVRGPAHSVRRGKTPVLDPKEARALLDAIDVTMPAGMARQLRSAACCLTKRCSRGSWHCLIRNAPIAIHPLVIKTGIADELRSVGVPGMGTGLEVRVLCGASW